MKEKTGKIFVMASAFFMFTMIGMAIGVGVGPFLSDDKDKDFVRTITGLECHQLEQYILEMEESWDKVIEYHSFKCVDFSEGNPTREVTT